MSAKDEVQPDDEAFRALALNSQGTRDKFIELVSEVRPALFRYCARMAGSVSDGEDLVQETLAKAYYELVEFREPMAIRPWLFRVAHNLAIDRFRLAQIRAAEPLEAAHDVPGDEELQPEAVLARQQTVKLAMSAFLRLAPAQRACVILKDVLEFSIDEIAAQLGMTVLAVKAALHRGRSTLQKIDSGSIAASPGNAHSSVLVRYTDLFNARDWDGVRALLADDVRLDVVNKLKASGKPNVGRYFTNYERLHDWYMEPAWLDGREILAVYKHRGASEPAYFVDIKVAGDRIEFIHDFRYVPYILQDTNLNFIGTPSR